MNHRIVGFAGGLGRPSKTRALVAHAVTATTTAFGGTAGLHDLFDLQSSLGQAARLDELHPRAARVVQDLLAADALIVGTPVHKGSYTGLFKHLFDLIEPEALAGKPVLLLATGGGNRHALVIEHQLRPLFGFFEALTLPTGIYAGNADFTDGEPSSPVLLDRIQRAVRQFSPWLGTVRTTGTALLPA
ncbi:FMN reductase [Cereibacter azotoformans]|uniref:MsuE subfamily FMN reductase n=1 Tax=Cereibacter azotoformans TaxID=43057 RepID=A0A2T5JT43_9RHOB|nr:FMN reductase [Cereibacter azotoformans]AXQ95730.1 FMN reductase [Cereibacter sphaeroides]PTR12974.1 MsuE subfamily FMN reductase [Cereibacter azotoformans]UIJ32770.1 FMN reductase [Cereibacter azotoformans]